MYKIYKADSRGKGDYGWLKTRYSFSFANYFNPERMGFGVLRVLNDDTIDAGMGFDFHSHDNMEIITIPLSGGLLHKDTMGNSEVVSAGEIQVMSAGSGVTHSEWNASQTDEVELLQIWLLSNRMNVEPRYDQMKYDASEPNTWQTIISPYPGSGGLWIYQDAWFRRGQFEEGFKTDYTAHDVNNGLYLFVIQGEIEVLGQLLSTRDAIEISGEDALKLNCYKLSDVLLIEVPLKG